MAKERFNKKGRNLVQQSKSDSKLVIPKKLSPEELVDTVKNHMEGMSKSKRKRLEKFMEKKSKKQRRSQLLMELKESSVVDVDFNKTSTLGQKVKMDRKPLQMDVEESDEDMTPIVQIRNLPIVIKDSTPIIEKTNTSFDFTTKRALDTSAVLGQADKLDQTVTRKYNIPQRSEEIEEFRKTLPIIQQEHDIMELLMNNDVIVICGATGSGKTTQIGQFCWEYGYSLQGKICITQPRKVAAMSIANRVQYELVNCKVGFQVRHESTVDPSTELIYMTDGILLKMMMTDLLLSKYSVIVIDEAHERNINTDILIGLLSRVVKLRREKFEQGKGNLLKLIIMSATMRIHDFTENTKLFNMPPPMINVPARMYPIVVHFNQITPQDYISSVVQKVAEIHHTYPPGNILCFLTGQKEVELVCDLLNESLSNKFVKDHPITIENDLILLEELDLTTPKTLNITENTSEEPITIVGEINEEEKADLLKTGTFGGQVVILPLFSILSSEEQSKCFLKYPNKRVIVVATNIAETSITIPNVKYVVDSGKVKEKMYNKATGMYKFNIHWTSKASAEQRMGRSGRTCAGHCFRLYSSTVHEHQFKQYSDPEILNMPIENVILHLKAMGIHHIQNFPFPSKPLHIQQGIELLQTLNALDKQEEITNDGLLMNKFPVNARFSKILTSCLNHHSLRYAITIVSILSANKQLEGSDLLKKLFDVCAKDYEQNENSDVAQDPVLIEIRDIRQQLVKILNKLLVSGFTYTQKLNPPNKEDLIILKKSILSGFIDHVAVPSKSFNNENDMPLTNIFNKQGLKVHRLKLMQNEILVYADVVNQFANNAIQMPLLWLGEQCLHMHKQLELIKDPLPIFDIKKDVIVGFISLTFKNTHFKPPIFQIELPKNFSEDKQLYGIFSFLLLNGISEPFISFKKYLITKPHVLLNHNVFVSKAVQLIQVLQANKVYNLTQLTEKWTKNNLFLLNDILSFYNEQSHQYIRSLWPPFTYVKSKIVYNPHHLKILAQLNK